MYVCMYVHVGMYVCMYVCVYVCMYVCKKWYMYMYIHVHVHVHVALCGALRSGVHCSPFPSSLPPSPTLLSLFFQVSGEGTSQVVELVSEFATPPPSLPPPSPPPMIQPVMSMEKPSPEKEKEERATTCEDALVKQLIGKPVHATQPVMTPSIKQLNEITGRRLCSEVHRLLLIHHKHCLTLEELEQKFEENDDPAHPSPQQLLDCITKFGGVPEKCPYKFIVDSQVVRLTLSPSVS